MIRASIVGASGYAGGELLRLLLGHPEVEVAQITSETYAGQYAHFVHPNLRGCTTLRFAHLAEIEACDLLYLALPHGQAMSRIGVLAGLAERIIDLSGDFRLRNPDDYVHWYELEHPAPAWLAKFVYGLPELHRGELVGARYASGTGCNATVTILALWPLYRRGLVAESVVEVKVGSSEGGNKANPASHHPERSGVVRTYSPFGHRHIAEITQELGIVLDQPGVHFSVTSVGIVRGALATCHCLLTEPVEERALWGMFRADYGDEPFIRLVRGRRGIHRYPEPKIISGANYCDIGFVADERPSTRGGRQRIVVIGAIDNLMKGAAGNAVQTMNVMYGWPETTGLGFPGLHPI
jgi:N-acetyl-gamma-glutamyl-phosphate/LysW-gamma-L-alpha-aminoadipyl-6-phosphate reductase